MTNVVKFTNKKRHSFYCLQSGQAFIYEEGLYIKIVAQTTNSHSDSNAVNMVDGRQVWMGGDLQVEPVDLEMIVQ